MFFLFISLVLELIVQIFFTFGYSSRFSLLYFSSNFFIFFSYNITFFHSVVVNDRAKVCCLIVQFHELLKRKRYLDQKRSESKTNDCVNFRFLITMPRIWWVIGACVSLNFKLKIMRWWWWCLSQAVKHTWFIAMEQRTYIKLYSVNEGVSFASYDWVKYLIQLISPFRP